MMMYIEVSDEAIKRYQKAFDVKLVSKHKNDDGNYLHAELDVQFIDKFNVQ